MSGVNLNGRQIRKGAADAIAAHVERLGGSVPLQLRGIVDRIAKEGATPHGVTQCATIFSAIQLKEMVKLAIQDLLDEPRRAAARIRLNAGIHGLTGTAI